MSFYPRCVSAKGHIAITPSILHCRFLSKSLASGRPKGAAARGDRGRAAGPGHAELGDQVSHRTVWISFAKYFPPATTA